jgi:hypothetical protein
MIVKSAEMHRASRLSKCPACTIAELDFMKAAG